MLQAELLQQVAVNRPRLLAVLEKAAADVPARQLEADKRIHSEEYVTAYFNVSIPKKLGRYTFALCAV